MPCVRALVVTNMYPTPERPAFGSLRARPGRGAAPPRRRRGRAVRLPARACAPTRRPRATLRRRHRARRFDVVHAHFGLTAWPALLARLGPVVVTLHGNDLFHPRSTASRAPRCRSRALPAAVSREFSENVPGAGTHAARRRAARRHRPRALPPDPARARRASASACDPDDPYLLFPHDPARPLKRFDRAQEAAGDVPLLTMGNVAPDEVPYWINAANAVLVPSQAEGFGLAVIEALACGVPALGTPVGIHPVALDGIAGALCAPFDRDALARARCARTSRPPTRAWTAARAPSCSPPTAWPPAWSRPGAAGWRSAEPRPRAYTRTFGALPATRPARHERPVATHHADAPRPPTSPRRNAGGLEPVAPPRLPRGGPRPVRGGARARGGAPAPPPRPPRRARRRPLDAPVGDDARRGGRCAAGCATCARVREVLLRDLGGLVFEVHRAGAAAARRPAATSSSARLDRLAAVDEELRELEALLDDRARGDVVREPGIGGTCPPAASCTARDARFCWHCGTPCDRARRPPTRPTSTARSPTAPQRERDARRAAQAAAPRSPTRRRASRPPSRRAALRRVHRPDAPSSPPPSSRPPTAGDARRGRADQPTSASPSPRSAAREQRRDAPPPTPVERRCPRCGAPLSAEQDWCLNCGAAVATRIAGRAAGAPRSRSSACCSARAVGRRARVRRALRRRPRRVTEVAQHADARRRGRRRRRRRRRPATRRGARPRRPRRADAERRRRRRRDARPPTRRVAGGQTAWTVILTPPARREDAERLAGELGRARASPGVGILDSDDFESLRPGLVRRLQRHLRRGAADEALQVRDRRGVARRIVPRTSVAAGERHGGWSSRAGAPAADRAGSRPPGALRPPRRQAEPRRSPGQYGASRRSAALASSCTAAPPARGSPRRSTGTSAHTEPPSASTE